MSEISNERSVCLVPIWDLQRFMCGMGTNGKCHRHGAHRPHPDDGRTCDPMSDGYCSTHGVYMDPRRTVSRPASAEV